MHSCDNRLAGGPLVCTRTDVHTAGRGCVYKATWYADHHDRSEHHED